jgi:hypothetical protein
MHADCTVVNTVLPGRHILRDKCIWIGLLQANAAAQKSSLSAGSDNKHFPVGREKRLEDLAWF